MILDKHTADKKLRRMALEVAERNYENKEIILIGIKENGIFIAQKIEAYLLEVFPGFVRVISLEIDKKNPGEIKLSEETDFNNKTILLIDDVANSGRTMLYALKPLLQQHPRQIQTLALVERTHKQFPIDVNYVGLSVSTTLQENIVVDVEGGEVLGARLENN
ncbi:phosphoribosyltransferase family protein [Ferruginibacter sp. HRS2-29]|uniref:phosphoribosyltransferase family protein n=1 Tax=Ferruginibacter sp. HRS2-29 TaxID=2487334 RepID=UPI0020CD0EBC|nr:phosphoribosyltransferase family protein [Ferruginibacter sp. HRS2-29]MCP9749758.1 phosphoribosyltransferase [Ferruginibacter sp. HRS2-29]